MQDRTPQERADMRWQELQRDIEALNKCLAERDANILQLRKYIKQESHRLGRHYMLDPRYQELDKLCRELEKVSKEERATCDQLIALLKTKTYEGVE